MSGGDDFRTLAEAAFGPLIQRYGLHVASPSPQRLELSSYAARVSISLERSDLFVDISSMEDNPIHRTLVGLSELVACKAPSGQELAPAPATQTLRERLEAAAALLERYGTDELSGDFSLRPRLLEYRASEWLDSKYHDIIVARSYASVDEGLAQVKWEFARFVADERKALWIVLERWLENEDVSQRQFAERVVAVL